MYIYTRISHSPEWPTRKNGKGGILSALAPDVSSIPFRGCPVWCLMLPHSHAIIVSSAPSAFHTRISFIPLPAFSPLPYIFGILVFMRPIRPVGRGRARGHALSLRALSPVHPTLLGGQSCRHACTGGVLSATDYVRLGQGKSIQQERTETA